MISESSHAGDTSSVHSDDSSVVSDMTAETLDTLDSAQGAELDAEMSAAKKDEAEDARMRKRAANKAAKKWCEENFISSKAIGLVEATKRDLLRAAKNDGLFEGDQVSTLLGTFTPFFYTLTSKEILFFFIRTTRPYA